MRLDNLPKATELKTDVVDGAGAFPEPAAAESGSAQSSC